MSGQKRDKFLQKGLRFLQSLLIRLCRSFVALLKAPLLLLQKREKKTKPSTGNSANSFISRRPNFSLRLFKNQRHAANSGFVLPTIAILLLIMSLVVSSLLFRSLNRTTQVIGQRNQQVIYNAATPAIDRAKAKLEYLFRQDIRLPGGLPSDEFMTDMLRNQGAIAKPVIDIDPDTPGNQNPYNFPEEERLDLNNDGTPDNAWSFKIDTNGDGNLETVAYSILSNTGITGTTDPRQQTDSFKAPQLIVRNGPINLQAPNSTACQGLLNARTPTNLSSNERQWDAINNAVARRAFQVTALVINDQNQASRTIATLEMQQDRQASRGNRWGAWFRNDLEIFPGPLFRWNGAMHTEGNLVIGGTSFQSFLISSPDSCLFTRDSSEITVGGDISESAPPYLGQIINGTIRDNNYNGNSVVHLFNPSGTNGKTDATLNAASDSVKDSAPNPANISLDPVILFTTDRNQTRDGDEANTSVRDTTWKDKDIYKAGRIFNRSAQAPYVDDTYRADDRYGPKAVYNSVIRPFFNANGTPTGRKSGQSIPSSNPFYTPLTNLSTVSPESQGLDGYWERRAWAEGLRVIVGQRLELGNAFGWLGNNDPLYPPVPGAANTTHEQRQWKTLRDNLAAVQATAIYHSDGNSPTDDSNGRFPRACLATTAHPGTNATINNSTTFNPITFNTSTAGTSTTRVVTDFLSGRGTNGWEFNPPAANETNFKTAIASSAPLGIALRNLAHLAGDGAADGSTDLPMPTRTSVTTAHFHQCKIPQLTPPFPQLEPEFIPLPL
ncbi:MAG: hypothetical protein HC820_02385 [Hydrococcus sp. RM1_1_31]|nr:hypothetical protein [Hydrococcus sp. RM1_1_31]